jgi:DNA-binding NarL/FixJ family response regulator
MTSRVNLQTLNFGRFASSLLAGLSPRISVYWLRGSTALASSHRPWAALICTNSGRDQRLRLIAAGNANKQIADQLKITEETVKSRVKSILSKLGANDRTHAAMIGIKRGIIEL